MATVRNKINPDAPAPVTLVPKPGRKRKSELPSKMCTKCHAIKP